MDLRHQLQHANACKAAHNRDVPHVGMQVLAVWGLRMLDKSRHDPVADQLIRGASTISAVWLRVDL